jgi:murein DD-endopeptidase MepM/ murein hydrolase activator NlpD
MSYQSSPLKNILFCLSMLVITASCTTSGPAGFFAKKSPHELYGEKIKNAGLQETALGKHWFSAAEQSLASPLTINLPYTETGYFSADQPKAAGLLFHGKRGEKLSISLSKKPTIDFSVYLDLWQPPFTGDNQPKLLLYADTIPATIAYDLETDGSYILRIQPELLKSGEYTLSISTGPSLAFPVAPKVKSTIGSFWGSGRDAGARKHEGIDIFAPRGTALVAAADGVVTAVTENRLGGKVLFLRPDNKHYALYYAHLDQQLVQPGQTVKTGDTIGIMGNTGNARTTSPHLHFGIYTNSGAVDPLPFIHRVSKIPEKISAPLSNLGNWVRNKRKIRLLSQLSASAPTTLIVEVNTLLKVEAATSSWYKVSLPGGEKGFVASSAVSPVLTPISKGNLKMAQPLLDEPNYFAARKTTVPSGETINILGNYKDFYYINRSNREEGWISKKTL